jgi:hypothetical protein
MSVIETYEFYSQVTCSNCGNQSCSSEEFTSLSLDVLPNLLDALTELTKPDMLDGKNRYATGVCDYVAL